MLNTICTLHCGGCCHRNRLVFFMTNVADLGPPPRPKIFSISCSFSQNLAKLCVGTPLPQRVSAPSYVESWIRPWYMHPTIHITAEAVNRRSPIWLRWLQSSRTNSAADPGFPRGGGANSPWGGGRQHTILSNFPKNCMKLNEFGPGGACVPRAPLRSATAIICPTFIHIYTNFTVSSLFLVS